MAGLRVAVACAGLICGATRVAGLRAQSPGELAESMGAAQIEISCSRAAQAAFDRAMALLHHMTYQEAMTLSGVERSFWS